MSIFLGSGRLLAPAMVNWFDAALERDSFAQAAIQAGAKPEAARVLFRLAAGSCLGIREVGSSNAGPLVSLMQATVGRPDPVPWCMAFVQTCLAYAELRCKVPSPLKASEHCLTVWRHAFAPGLDQVAVRGIEYPPEPGAVVIWRRGESEQGHCGVVWSVNGPNFQAVEGNTAVNAPGGSVERDGGGVALTARNMAGVGPMHVLGFLRPF